MFKYLNKKRQKGQSTLEYAILIIIIIGALLSIQIYIRRGIQGRLKSATDDIGTQFSPGNTNIVRTMHTSSNTEETFISGESNSKLVADEITTSAMNSEIMDMTLEFWGKAE